MGWIRRFFGRRTVTLGLSVLALIAFIRHQQPVDSTSNLKQIAHKVKFSEAKILAAKSSHDAAVLDSVFAILQNYYVDKDRVTHLDLINKALNFLKSNEDITVIDKEDAYHLHDSQDPQNPLVLSKNISSSHDLIYYYLILSQLIDSEHSLDSKLLPEDKNWVNPEVFSLVNASLKQLDPHSALLTSYAYKELRQSTEGSFGGLGVVVGIKDNVLTVIKPIPHSPAFRAGISELDKIVRINGQGTFGATLESLVEHMRGVPGSSVTLSLLPRDSNPQEIILKREIIQLESVTSKVIQRSDRNFVLITVDAFSDRTSSELREAIKKFQDRSIIHGIILDLRSNPGGLLEQAVLVSDLFLKNEVILSTSGHNRDMDFATSDPSDFKYPLAVIINSESASASEIVAGALQDNKRALVIGQPSFGKGSVQTVFELPNDEAIKITISRYFTPSGQSIQNHGITPDIWVQPVYMKQSNDALLGEVSFRKESRLKYHLNSISGKEYSSNVHYYLHDAKSNPSINLDYELDLAIKSLQQGVFSEDGYIKRSPYSSLRSYIDKYDNEVKSWLADNHKIEWKSSKNFISTSEHRISLDVKPSKSPQVGIDSNLSLAWSIKNDNKVPFHRVSLYVDINEGEAVKEILVGEVHPGIVNQGIAIIPMTFSTFNDQAGFKVGLAIDGQPTDIESSGAVEIIEGQKPDLKITAIYQDYEVTDENFKNHLDPGDEGNITLTIENTGVGVAHDIQAGVTNLAGNQAKLSQESFDIGDLNPGEVQNVTIPIKANDSLSSQTVYFGLSVSASNHARKFRHLVDIPVNPNKEVYKAHVAH